MPKFVFFSSAQRSKFLRISSWGPPPDLGRGRQLARVSAAAELAAPEAFQRAGAAQRAWLARSATASGQAAWRQRLPLAPEADCVLVRDGHATFMLMATP